MYNRFAFSVEATIANLKEALAPHVITNGRNLWVHWRRIDKDALVVVVDVKLPYPGGSTAYYDAVGQCNVLIAKAIQDAGAWYLVAAAKADPTGSDFFAESTELVLLKSREELDFP